MSSKAELNQKTPCILEIGDKGIKMIDKSKPGVGFFENIPRPSTVSLLCQDGGVPSHEYFFSLKNVTFCGFHPRDHRYFGFITKVSIKILKRNHLTDISQHPAPCIQKYACHVFVSESSTRCVAQAYGWVSRETLFNEILNISRRRAFRRFYQKYIETAYPTEDIYLE